jgi:hypothetical protein
MPYRVAVVLSGVGDVLDVGVVVVVDVLQQQDYAPLPACDADVRRCTGSTPITCI